MSWGMITPLQIILFLFPGPFSDDRARPGTKAELVCRHEAIVVARSRSVSSLMRPIGEGLLRTFTYCVESPVMKPDVSPKIKYQAMQERPSLYSQTICVEGQVIFTFLFFSFFCLFVVVFNFICLFLYHTILD